MDSRDRLAAALATLEALLAGEEPRRVRAKRAAEAIQQAGGYRWVGLYDVSEREIAVIAWSGPAAPAHPSFPRSQGLNGAAVASGRAVVVQDVSQDTRYLPTLDDTRGEMIMPVRDAAGLVVGTIDVESAMPNAFAEQDHQLLERAGSVLRPLWDGSRR